MTITLFVPLAYLPKFLEITESLKGLGLENDYVFDPRSCVFSEDIKEYSSPCHINMEISEYLKLRYCHGKMVIKSRVNG